MKNKHARLRHGVLGVLLTLMFAWPMVLDGVVAHYHYDQHPTLTRFLQGAPRDTAIVVLAQSGASSTSLAQAAMPQLISHGDVIAVEYNRQRFDGPVVSYTTALQLQQWGYKKAILAGDGFLGNLVATDVLNWCRNLDCKTQYAVIMYNAPPLYQLYTQPTSYELEQPDYWAGYAAKAMHPGPFINWVWSLYKPDELPRSGWATQERYMSEHPGYLRNSFKGTPLVLLQSQGTTEQWQAVFGGGQVISASQQWQTAVPQALSALPAGW